MGSTSTIHPLGCSCRACTRRDGNQRPVLKKAARVLCVALAVIAIPFIIVISLYHAKGDRR
jgi:predicted transcriptional regulator